MNIYVGNLSLAVTEDELRKIFVIFGQVTSVTLMNDMDIGSGQGRRCGYIEMPSLREGESAIEQMQGKSSRGRLLDVIRALPVTRTTNNNKAAGNSTALGFHRKISHAGRIKRDS
jgi:RNA recognition motif-containing protein